MQKASFINHKVTDEGVYVRGLTGPGFTPDIEIFVPRAEAEEFGWIDPLPQLERPCADCGKNEALYKIQFCLECLHKKKLAEWNAMNQR
jgi:hypothetical protein